jgi:hypothetical protein
MLTDHKIERQMDKQNIEKEVTDIMNVLDRFGQVEADPWLYERIMARMLAEKNAPIANPRVENLVWSTLCVLFVFNIVGFWHMQAPGLFASPAEALVQQYVHEMDQTDLLQMPFSR